MGTNEKVRLGKEHYTPQEISAFILKSLKKRAETVLKRPISKAIITVPAYFTDAQRYATREAGEIAGLEVVRIINEPTAAALAYGTQKEENQRILVYDLGGGTFDVSIVTIENSVVEVMASTGNNHLGGDDFDTKIVDRLLEHLETEHGLKAWDDQALRARLKRAAEAAKIHLSDYPYALLEEDHVGRVRGVPVHLKYELSRMEFEEMIQDDLMETMEAISKALRDAALLPGAIEKILLVGGSTRIPLVSKLLGEKLGKMPHSEVDPDLCVALGAAIQAGIEMGQEVGSVLVDVTPYTFGTSAFDHFTGNPYVFVPLIHRNSKLPITKSDVFATLHDNQEAVDIHVYQGEDPDARNNILIGRFYFKGLSPVPAGNEIVMTFSLDVNGLLKIHAVEKRSGRDIRGVVENAMRSFDDAQINGSKQRIDEVWGEDEDLFVDEVEAIKDGDKTEAAIIEKTIKHAREMMEQASEEDQEDVIDLIEKIQDAMKENDLKSAMKFQEELDDLLFYLE
jgi:molecular chaperone DnaK (HSP70)